MIAKVKNQDLPLVGYSPAGHAQKVCTCRDILDGCNRFGGIWLEVQLTVMPSTAAEGIVQLLSILLMPSTRDLQDPIIDVNALRRGFWSR